MSDRLQKLWTIAKKINSLLDQGYIAIDDRGELVDPLTRFVINGNELVFRSPEGVSISYYIDDPEYEDYHQWDQVLERLKRWKFAKLMDFDGLEATEAGPEIVELPPFRNYRVFVVYGTGTFGIESLLERLSLDASVSSVRAYVFNESNEYVALVLIPEKGVKA